MAIMMRDLYRALVAAGASEDEAGRASEEVAGFNNRLSDLESRVALVQWMIGVNIALTIAVFVKLFIH